MAEREHVLREMAEIRKHILDWDLDAWKGVLLSEIPDGQDFIGKAFCFAYYDEIRIRKWIMKAYPLHEDTDRDVQFCFSVFAAPYRNRVVAAWVYVCRIKPVPEGEETAAPKDDPILSL